MPEISIYDSQGNPLAESEYKTNERIRNFFFDGVRLTIDTSGGTLEIVCFFRARENETSRSEQYYAVFKSRKVDDASKFGSVVERRVENELGLVLDTSTEDTKIFDLLRTNEDPSASLPQHRIQEIIDLLSNNRQAKIGTSTYRDAYGILRRFVREQSRGRYAIVENANSPRFSQYDLVIEKGSYAGTEIFDETEAAIEKVKQRRRRQRQDRSGHGSSSSYHLVDVGIAVGIVGGMVVVLTLLATILLCSFGNFAVPVLGQAITDCGVNLNVDEATWDGDEISVTGDVGNIKGEGLNEPVNMTVTVKNNSDAGGLIPFIDNSERINIKKENVSVSEDGNFNVSISTRSGSPGVGSESGHLNLSNGNHTVIVKYNAGFLKGSDRGKSQIQKNPTASEPASANTSTISSDPTPTSTATQAPTTTPTNSSNRIGKNEVIWNNVRLRR